MSIKKLFAVLAAAGLLAGGVALAGTARAATPSCGAHCPDVFTVKFGQHGAPGFVLDVFRRGARAGQPVILFAASGSDPAEDWKITTQATVYDFYAAGLVSSAVNLHYHSDPAVEIEYAPYGVDSGLCAGMSWIAGNGTGVSLQPCGVSARTVWIIDAADASGATEGSSGVTLAATGFVPVIAGSDTNFSTPYVLTYPANGYPTDKPRPQLMTAPLLRSAGGQVPAVQMWGYDDGALK